MSGDDRAKSRRFRERKPEYRTEAQRDRDRVLYCSAFQRLSGITQIASAEPGQGMHNRLTHSLKVAQVARRLAQRLKFGAKCQDTAETAALAHDLGHPPFGHVAETELKVLSKPWGGFEGNAQSFRIVNKLARRDPAYDGLNLMPATLNGMLKYPWFRKPGHSKKEKKWGAYRHEAAAFNHVRRGHVEDKRTVEAELMDWADDVTYAVHDLEDFYRLGLIPLEGLVRNDELGKAERERFLDSFFVDKRSGGQLREEFDGLSEGGLKGAMELIFGGVFSDVGRYRGTGTDRALVRNRTSVLIGRFIRAVTRAGHEVKIGETARAEVAVLKELAWFYAINDPSLATIQHGQRRVIHDLHEAYIAAVDSPGKSSIFPRAQRELLDEYDDDEAAAALRPTSSRGSLKTLLTSYITASLGLHAVRSLMPPREHRASPPR